MLKPLHARLSHLAPLPLAHVIYDTRPHPLVVHHGLMGSKSNWASLCKLYHFRTKRRVVALDARNHGESPHSPDHTYEHLVADLLHLVDRLKSAKVCLLGHSMGGRAAMLFALKHPALVEKLIIADISPVTTSPLLESMPSLLKLLERVDLPKGVSMSTARTHVDKQLAEKVDDKHLRAFLMMNLTQKDGDCRWKINIPVLLANFAEIARFPEVGDKQFGGPVLFVGGGESDFLPKSDHEGIRRLFPRAQFTYIDGTGHWLHIEKPWRFLDITVGFLKQK